jgi:hypothetical protein
MIANIDITTAYWAIAAVFFVAGVLASRFGLIDTYNSEFSFFCLFIVPALWPIFVAVAVMGGFLYLTFRLAMPPHARRGKMDLESFIGPDPYVEPEEEKPPHAEERGQQVREEVG